MTTCAIAARHCESCGSTDREDLTTGDQGYSACCNERVTDQADEALYMAANRKAS